THDALAYLRAYAYETIGCDGRGFIIHAYMQCGTVAYMHASAAQTRNPQSQPARIHANWYDTITTIGHPKCSSEAMQSVNECVNELIEHVRADDDGEYADSDVVWNNRFGF